MNIVLHIERIVLDGVPLSPGGDVHVRHAIVTELSRLLGQRGLDAALLQGGALERSSAVSMPFNSSASASQLGGQVAGAVTRVIGA